MIDNEGSAGGYCAVRRQGFFVYCMTCFGKRNDAEMMQKEQKI